MKRSSFVKLLKKPAFIVGALLLAISAAIFVARLLVSYPSQNEQLTSAAWEYFENQKYDEAIKKAEECVSEFGGQAQREQQTLSSSQTPVPPVGGVSEGEKRAISSRGVLNDVATCYFIKGRALERMRRYGEAKEAYRMAQQFPHARAWDVRGWYWSPADAAVDRMAQLP